MTREEKLHMLGYYEGIQCVCGAVKHEKHWLCEPCRVKFYQTPEGKRLDKACEEHTNAAIAYLFMVKKEHEKLQVQNG